MAKARDEANVFLCNGVGLNPFLLLGHSSHFELGFLEYINAALTNGIVVLVSNMEHPTGK